MTQGKTAGVDLKGKVPEGERFRYVRLTDLEAHGSGTYPGADIDAISGLNFLSPSIPSRYVWAFSLPAGAGEDFLILGL